MSRVVGPTHIAYVCDEDGKVIGASEKFKHLLGKNLVVADESGPLPDDFMEVMRRAFDEAEKAAREAQKAAKEGERKMSNIRVTANKIDHLMQTAKVETDTVFGKCTVVAMQFENGFIMVESSACVDPANYDKAMGERICKDKIRDRLWELEGYALQKAVHKLTMEV